MKKVEVRVEAENEEGFKWVGHGVAFTPEEARQQAEKRMPEGYTRTGWTQTKDDVDGLMYAPHREWVWPNEARRVERGG